MPFKYHQARASDSKQSRSPKPKNWSLYNKRLKIRGDIAIWLSPDVIENWIVRDRKYDGNGAPKFYSDMAIQTVHEIRQVFRLPLRQCEGFVNGLFALMKINLTSPEFSTLSKRLKKLKLNRPFCRLAHPDAMKNKIIAIDSTGLKCYGLDEWALEKYGKDRQKR